MNKKQKIVLLSYVFLLIAGGIMGYIKSGSLASVIMSSSIALVLGYLTLKADRIKKSLIYITVLLLGVDLFFTYRFFKTHKFMPAGLFAIVTFVVLVLLLKLTKKVKK